MPDDAIPVSIQDSVTIAAAPSRVWTALTRPALMQIWMSEPDMALEIEADWTPGGAVTMRGVHHTRFENTGRVLACQPGKLLRYSHRSSLSGLPDMPRNHTIIEFTLEPQGQETLLTLTLSRFPTTSIYQHMAFYWRSALRTLKLCVEQTAR